MAVMTICRSQLAGERMTTVNLADRAADSAAAARQIADKSAPTGWGTVLIVGGSLLAKRMTVVHLTEHVT
jgi:hypothetical protein